MPDHGEEQTARKVVRDAVAQLGRLDILVNNAAVQRARRSDGLESLTTDELDEVMRSTSARCSGSPRRRCLIW